MHVIRQAELERKVNEAWAYATVDSDEDGPTIQDAVLLCTSCGQPVGKAVAVSHDMVCRSCLLQALHMLEVP